MRLSFAEVLQPVDFVVIFIVHLSEELGDFELFVFEEEIIVFGFKMKIYPRVSCKPSVAKAHVNSREGIT